MALTKTKVLSTRVTPDVFDAIHRMAKTNKMSVSDYLGNVATSRLPAVPVNAVDKVEVPEELTTTLKAFGGGFVLGAVTYKILKANLPKDRYTKAQIDMYSFIGAFSVGILGAIGIAKMIKALGTASK
jgi:hypothetical protein